MNCEADRSTRFDVLVEHVAACRLCPTMEGRRRVLSALNGSIDARVLFIAEAPGRFGGDRSGIPLTLDQSGRNFERLLRAAGLPRNAIFVTNAVLCNPRDARGNNRPPRPVELAACASHLAAQLDLVAAPFVVTLGGVALRAVERLERHGLRLRSDVGRPVPWRGRTLVALYHPGPQAMIHRPVAQQWADYLELGRLVSPKSSS